MTQLEHESWPNGPDEGLAYHFSIGLMAGHPIPQKESYHFELGADELHIWFIATHGEGLPEDLSSLEASLNSQEFDRYHHLVRSDVRQNFLLSRGCLRYLLGLYLNRRPGDLEFTLGRHGKPELVSSGEFPPLQFNLSHTGGRLAIALHRHKVVGIDIERLRPVTHLKKLCRRCLTHKEAQTVLTVGLQPGQYRFLRYWTAKEAVLKALGLGLSFPMNRWEVILGLEELSSQPVEVPITLSVPKEEVPGFDRYKLYQWRPEDNYLAAVAIQDSLAGFSQIIHRQNTTPRKILKIFREVRLK